MAPDEARTVALGIWRKINLQNLEQNILPTKRRAQLILLKGKNHRVETVSLRRL
jgi:type I pantothenate kinase